MNSNTELPTNRNSRRNHRPRPTNGNTHLLGRPAGLDNSLLNQLLEVRPSREEVELRDAVDVELSDRLSGGDVEVEAEVELVVVGQCETTRRVLMSVITVEETGIHATSCSGVGGSGGGGVVMKRLVIAIAAVGIAVAVVVVLAAGAQDAMDSVREHPQRRGVSSRVDKVHGVGDALEMELLEETDHGGDANPARDEEDVLTMHEID